MNRNERNPIINNTDNDRISNRISDRLPTEDELEDEANNHVGIMKNFRIAKAERSRFILFGIMFGIIGFIYSFMRILKDTYVMVRQEPICILYLKIFYVMPASFALVLIINYMLSYRTVSRIFSIFCLVFAAIFFSFGIIAVVEDKILFDRSFIRNQILLRTIEARGLGWTKYLLTTVNELFASLIYLTA